MVESSQLRYRRCEEGQIAFYRRGSTYSDPRNMRHWEKTRAQIRLNGANVWRLNSKTLPVSEPILRSIYLLKQCLRRH